MPLRHKKKRHNLHSSPSPPPRRPKRRRLPLNYSLLLALPREIRETIYSFLFPSLTTPLYLCLGNDHRSPRRSHTTTLGPCSPYTTLRTALCLSNSCRQLRAEIQESYFRRQVFALHVCNLAPLRGRTHRPRWCLCAVALGRIARVRVRYSSLTIPEFEVVKSVDGTVRVRFTETRGEERALLAGLEVYRREDYVRWRRWSMVVIQRKLGEWLGRGRRVSGGFGFGWREIRGVEEGLKEVHGWCWRM